MIKKKKVTKSTEKIMQKLHVKKKKNNNINTTMTKPALWKSSR